MYLSENDISKIVIGKAIDLKKTVGPGLLESAYENALANDLLHERLEVKQQVPMAFIYKDVKLDVGYRIDLMLNNKVIIEVKSIESLTPVHYAQTLTYLKPSGLKLALLKNFNSQFLKESNHRIVNNL